jgi:hypothetical protein
MLPNKRKPDSFPVGGHFRDNRPLRSDTSSFYRAPHEVIPAAALQIAVFSMSHDTVTLAP